MTYKIRLRDVVKKTTVIYLPSKMLVGLDSPSLWETNDGIFTSSNALGPAVTH